MSATITLSELFKGLGKTKGRLPAKTVQALVTDSRRVVPGTVFVALRGLKTNGNFYIEEAINRGAEAIVSEESPGRAATLPWLQVPDARETLARLAARFHGEPARRLKIAGVTGTNGKTTVTMLLQHFLKAQQLPCGLIGTVRYDIGERTFPAYRTTPESVDVQGLLSQMVQAGCQWASLEISSHAIDQHRVLGLPVAVAAFLNLSHDHLDYHGDMESYFAVKARLLTGGLDEPPGHAVINSGDAWGRRLMTMLPTAVAPLTFGPEGDFRAENLRLMTEVTSFTLQWPGGTMPVETSLLGHYNADNLLAALAMVHAAGASVPQAVQALEHFAGVPGRMERVDDGEGFKVLVDYAHTDDALRNALTMLREITPGRLLLVFGCGGNRDRAKRPLMMRVAQELADFSWVTADNPRRESIRQIFDDMRPAVEQPQTCEFIDDRRRAIAAALAEARGGDTVLIAGKGHEPYQEMADTVQPFDDRLVARELLRHRRLGQGGEVSGSHG